MITVDPEWLVYIILNQREWQMPTLKPSWTVSSMPSWKDEGDFIIIYTKEQAVSQPLAIYNP